MPDPQGIVTWPGLTDFSAASYTCSWGITPSSAYIETVPGQNLSPTGILTFEYGGRMVLGLRDCILVQPQLQTDPDVWRVQILDRRWKWKYGHISGRYNVRGEDGKIPEINERTPRELAEMLLTEMGENVARSRARHLPNNLRPVCNWDYINPAVALARLCDECGFVVVFDPIRNRPELHLQGRGQRLPRAGAMNNSWGFNVRPKPRSIMCVGAPIRHEAKFRLEAVGKDTDDDWKPIDKLSYAPDGGWSNKNTQPPFYDGVESLTNKKAKELAIRTVYRSYRINRLAGAGHEQAANRFFLPTGPANNQMTRQHILPLSNQLVANVQILDDAGEVLYTRPSEAFIEGTYFVRDETASWFPIGEQPPATARDVDAATDEPNHYPYGFSIDLQLGIVHFNHWVCLPTDQEAADAEDGDVTALLQPAEMYLTCSWAYKDPDTGQPQRFNLQRNLPQAQGGGADTGPLLIFHNDIKRVVSYKYRSSNKKVGDRNKLTPPTESLTQVDERVDGFEHLGGAAGHIDNNPEMIAAANHYIDAKIASLQDSEGLDVEYNGLLRSLRPDGTIAQITWQCGGQAATTRVGRNTEPDISVPDFEFRRDDEKRKAWEVNFLDADVSPSPHFPSYDKTK